MEACAERFCSVASLTAGEDPIGTATPADLLLIMEVALPWEGEVWKSPGFPPGLFNLVAAYTNQMQVRLLCIVPDQEYSRPGRRRLMVLRRPSGPLARFDREEYLLPSEQLIPLVQEVLEGRPLDRFAPWRQEVEGVRDLMVCTHGSKDAACGRFGYPIYERLRREYAPATPGLRVWRVSHFGGHRFAATVLDLPEFRSWAHLAEERLDLLVHRSGSPAGLRRFYRGWAGLATPFEQALEREALEQEGWPWLAYQKAGEVLQQAEEGKGARVAIHFRSPDGQVAGSYEAWVEVSHRVRTVLVSGKDCEEMPQYRVSGLVRRERRLTPAP